MAIKKLKDGMFRNVINSFFDFEELSELMFINISWNGLEEKFIRLSFIELVKLINFLWAVIDLTTYRDSVSK